MEANRIPQDNKRNRYNKSLKFIVHPESRFSETVFSSFVGITIGVIIWQFFLRMATNVPTSGLLLGGSLGFLGAWTYFKFWKIPRALKGYGEAYFKRTYQDAPIQELPIRFSFTDSISPVCMGIVIGNGMYFAHRYPVENSFETIWKLIWNFNPLGILAGAGIVWAIYYFNYGKEKYVSIREYSNLYNHFRKNGISNPAELHQRVLQKKDRDHNIHEFEGTYFDEKEVKEMLSDDEEENNSVRRKKRY